jgi:hypothetical protein
MEALSLEEPSLAELLVAELSGAGPEVLYIVYCWRCFCIICRWFISRVEIILFFFLSWRNNIARTMLGLLLWSLFVLI